MPARGTTKWESRADLFGASMDPDDLRRAERLVQYLRWLAIGSWAVLIQGATSSAGPATVYATYGAMLVYSALSHVMVRFASGIRGVAVLTTLGDTAAIAIMCLVTGGIESPVVPVFYLSVLATTIRFGVVEAFLIASFDALHGLWLYLVVGRGGAFELGELAFYLYFVALLGGMLSEETRRQHRRAVKEGLRSRLLLALNREIVASTDLRAMLSRMLKESLSATGAQYAVVRFLDAAGDDDGGDAILSEGHLPPVGEIERILEPDVVARVHREGVSTLPGDSPAVIASIRGSKPFGVVLFGGHRAAGRSLEEDSSLIPLIAEEIAAAVQKARLGADLVAAESRSRELLHRVIDAEEAERRRIAGDLHDRMGKRFFEFYYDARLLQGMSVDRDSASSEVLARIVASARECAGEIRAMMNDLRPSVLDDFGFLEALKEFITAVAARGELEVSLEVDENAPPAGGVADLMLFRIVQEAVFNARKHAEAKEVRIEYGIADDGRLRLLIRDDGRGFDATARHPGHYGLMFMKERAEACGADFEVRSAPGGGTEIEVRVAPA